MKSPPVSTLWIILSIVLLLPLTSPGQQDPGPPPDRDSTLIEPPVDDTTHPEPPPSDTALTEPPPDSVDTEPEKEKPVAEFDFADTLAAHFLDPRFDLADEAGMSFFRNAGGYLRPIPSNLIVDYQITPLRTTVRPHTLPGNRMNVIFNDRLLEPIEHLIEPDNMIDFNDIPTAPVSHVYNIEGPLGMALGGSGAVSSIILQPHRPETYRAESRMVVDKGDYGYAYTKGLFTVRNSGGRSVRVALGYRKSNGRRTGTDDNAYHQWGELIQPISPKLRLNLSGRLYRRDGNFLYRPESAGITLDRFRRDRDITAALELCSSPESKSLVEFRHQRSESRLDRISGEYYRSLKISDNSLLLSYSGRLGKASLQATATLSQYQVDEPGSLHRRHGGEIDLKYIRGDSSKSIMLFGRLEGRGGFDPAPSAAAVYSIIRPHYHLSASIGYSHRFPRPYELDLEPKSGILSIIDTLPDYYDSGNPGLKIEKQSIGNITLAYGHPNNDLQLSITGGRIADGIDWRKMETDDHKYGAYRPDNVTINFAGLYARQNITFRDIIRWHGGGACRYIEYDGTDNPPYSPDFQLFSGARIHLYIELLDLHLYAYGEAVYLDKYTGRQGTLLGEDIITNARVSFRVKRFHFFYVFQNILSRTYALQEDYPYSLWTSYYGVRWEFYD